MVVKCVWCGVEMNGELALLAHILSTHSPNTTQHDISTTLHHATPSTSEHPVISAPLNHKCSHCKKSYKNKKSLVRHEREAHSAVSFNCNKCKKRFKSKRTLLHHIKTIHQSKRASKCDRCGRSFSCQSELNVHIRRGQCKRNRKKVFTCRKCKNKYSSLQKMYIHRRTAHHTNRVKYICHACTRKFQSTSTYMYHKYSCKARRNRALQVRKALPVNEEPQWESITAIDGDARIHTLNVSGEYDLQLSLINNKPHIQTMILTDLKDLKRLKWHMVAHIQVKNNDRESSENAFDLRYLRCPNFSLLREDEVEEQVREGITHTLTNFDSHQGEGSNILFEKVIKIELRVAKLSLIKGSSYLELPKFLNHSRKGLINIKNNDNKCFLYSILAGIQCPKKDPQRVTSYKSRIREINMKGVKYPVRVKDVSKVEVNNVFLSISVFGVEEEAIVPLYISRNFNRTHHVNLLQITDDKESHYVLIKNFSKFMSHLTKRKKALFWCENCLTPRPTEKQHVEHRIRCIEHNAQAIQMPTQYNSIMKFTDYEKQLHHDYVIYCDLECTLQPYSTVLPDPSKSSTTRTSRHVPSGFCYVVVGPEGTLLKPPVLQHGGENIVKNMLMSLKAEQVAIKKLRGEPHPIDMTEETEKAFQEASKCYLCSDRIPRENVPKVRDHDHTKEKDNYRGAACRGCNLNLKMRDFIPVFFHNLTGYDGHLIMSEIGQMSDGSDLSAIPKTKEKYISFSWGKLRFLDSFNFLSSSLEKLVRDLKPEEMQILKAIYPDDEKRVLVSRKGVYPYCYFDCIEKFEETKLPPKACFKSDLSHDGISDADYDHALNVFEKFNMDTLWDYHDLYLMTDVLLLADVMETYRKVTMDHFQLDVVHYYTTPGFSWSAALLYTRQRLELLECLDDHLMWEKGMRGGVATINCRSVYANNPYVPDLYDPSKDNSYLLYVDANNLYGAAMSRALPVGSFRQLSKTEIEELDIMKISETDEDGYLFEVSLGYPKKLHDKHNDFCLAPEHFAPQYSDVSPLQREMIEKLNLSNNSSIKKLIPNLKDKDNYVVYGTTLKLYLQLGLVLKKTHRVMAFEQKPWLAPYIAHNTEMRKKATSDFQKNLWKLKNNAVYGKTCEQTRKRRNILFTKKSQKFRKLVQSPLYHSFDIFDHGLVAVERRKAKVQLNRPMYTGQVVLDVSKEIMYNFHFNCMKKRYGDQIKVCASDTDSLIYDIKTNDIYDDMGEMSEWFDTSDYPANHPLHSNVNKKVLGKFKDELNGAALRAFVGLRPKMYSFQRADESVKCVGKGVPRSAISKLTFSDYEQCLKNMSTKRVDFKKIGTDQKHHLFTTHSVKRGLSCYDDKRYIMDDNIHTLAYGHYSIDTCGKEDGGTSDEPDVIMESDVYDEGAENLLMLIELMETMMDEL